MEFHQTSDHEMRVLCAPQEDVRAARRTATQAWICARDLAFLAGNPRFAEYPCILHLRMRISLRTAKILWRAGFGRDTDGSPLLGPDGRLVFAKPLGAPSRMGKMTRTALSALAFVPLTATPHVITPEPGFASERHSQDLKGQGADYNSERKRFLHNLVLQTLQEEPAASGGHESASSQRPNTGAPAKAPGSEATLPIKANERGWWASAYESRGGASFGENGGSGLRDIGHSILRTASSPMRNAVGQGVALGAGLLNSAPTMKARVGRFLAPTTSSMASWAEAHAASLKRSSVANVTMKVKGANQTDPMNPTVSFGQFKLIRYEGNIRSIIENSGVGIQLTKDSNEMLLQLQGTGVGWVADKTLAMLASFNFKAANVAKSISAYNAFAAQSLAWPNVALNAGVATGFVLEAKFGDQLQYINVSLVLDGSTTQRCLVSMLRGYWAVHLLRDPQSASDQFGFAADGVKFLDPNHAKACSNTRMLAQMRNSSYSHTDRPAQGDAGFIQGHSLEATLFGLMDEIAATRSEEQQSVAALNEHYPGCRNLIENAIHSDGDSWSVSEHDLKTCMEELTEQKGNAKAWSPTKSADLETKLSAIFDLSVRKFNLESSLNTARAAHAKYLADRNENLKNRRIAMTNQAAYFVCQVLHAKAANSTLMRNAWELLDLELEKLMTMNMEKSDREKVMGLFRNLIEKGVPNDVETQFKAGVEQYNIRDENIVAALHRGIVQGKEAVKQKKKCLRPESIDHELDTVGNSVVWQLLGNPWSVVAGVTAVVGFAFFGGCGLGMAKERCAHAEKAVGYTLSNANQQVQYIEELCTCLKTIDDVLSKTSEEYSKNIDNLLKQVEGLLVVASTVNGWNVSLEKQGKALENIIPTIWSELTAAATHIKDEYKIIAVTTCVLMSANSKLTVGLEKHQKALQLNSTFDNIALILERLNEVAGAVLHVGESGLDPRRMGAQMQGKMSALCGKYLETARISLRSFRQLVTDMNEEEEHSQATIHSISNKVASERLGFSTGRLQRNWTAGSLLLHGHNEFTTGSVNAKHFATNTSKLNQKVSRINESIQTLFESREKKSKTREVWYDQAMKLQTMLENGAHLWWQANKKVYCVSTNLVKSSKLFDGTNAELEELFQKLVAERKKQPREEGTPMPSVAEEALMVGLTGATIDVDTLSGDATPQRPSFLPPNRLQ